MTSTATTSGAAQIPRDRPAKVAPADWTDLLGELPDWTGPIAPCLIHGRLVAEGKVEPAETDQDGNILLDPRGAALLVWRIAHAYYRLSLDASEKQRAALDRCLQIADRIRDQIEFAVCPTCHIPARRREVSIGECWDCQELRRRIEERRFAAARIVAPFCHISSEWEGLSGSYALEVVGPVGQAVELAAFPLGAEEYEADVECDRCGARWGLGQLDLDVGAGRCRAVPDCPHCLEPLDPEEIDAVLAEISEDNIIARAEERREE